FSSMHMLSFNRFHATHVYAYISERLLGGPNEGRRQTSFCTSGLHPDGTYSCEAFFMAEESSSLASILRIIMLADALFEVLDETPFFVTFTMYSFTPCSRVCYGYISSQV
ncbi:hypothetical protein Pfo_023686, partial [Paulownia fortunei]